MTAAAILKKTAHFHTYVLNRFARDNQIREMASATTQLESEQLPPDKALPLFIDQLREEVGRLARTQVPVDAIKLLAEILELAHAAALADGHNAKTLLKARQERRTALPPSAMLGALCTALMQAENADTRLPILADLANGVYLHARKIMYTRRELDKMRQDLKRQHGGYTRRLYVSRVHCHPHSTWDVYFSQHPENYKRQP